MASSELVTTIKNRLFSLERQINEIRLRADIPYRVNDKVETVSGILYNTLVNQQELIKLERQLRSEIDHLSLLIHRLLRDQERQSSRIRWCMMTNMFIGTGILSYILYPSHLYTALGSACDYVSSLFSFISCPVWYPTS